VAYGGYMFSRGIVVYYVDLFNNREEALVIWLVILFILLLSFKSTRKSLHGVLKAVLNKKILTVLIAMVVYVGLVVFLLYELNFWDAFLTKDTIFWFVGVALILLFSVDKATEAGGHYFMRVIRDALALIVVLEFIVNFYAFNLWIEMILLQDFKR
jgi:hypothetical protein